MTIVEGGVVADVTPAAVDSGRKPHARRHVMRFLAVIWIAVLVIVAVIVPLLPTPEPTKSVGRIAAAPFGHYILGTDQLGRDIFARLAYGARLSVEVAFFSTGIAFVVGVAMGVTAGYFRGKIDLVIAAIADLGLALPGLVLLLVLTSVRGASARVLIFGLSILLTPAFIRLSRANALVYMQREFVHAARSIGARNLRIMLREILPNVLPSVTVYALTAAAQVFVVEGTLSFLGLGIPPPHPSWGSMIASGQLSMRTSPHIVLIPCVVLFLTVLSLNVLGNSRQDAGSGSGTVGGL